MLRKWCEFDGLSDFDKPQIRCMINIDSKSFPGFILRLQSNHTVYPVCFLLSARWIAPLAVIIKGALHSPRKE